MIQCGRSVYWAIANFAPQDRYIIGAAKAELHAIALHFEYGYFNSRTNANRFILLAAQYEHGRNPLEKSFKSLFRVRYDGSRPLRQRSKP